MTAVQDAEQGVAVAGRYGLACRGFVYCLVAVIALQVAAGDHEQSLDRQGALRAVARQRFGAVLLAALAVGFLGYALWRLAEAVAGEHELPSRLLHAARGILYGAFSVSAARLVLHRGSSGGSDEQAKTWSAELLQRSGGRPLVVAVGIGLGVVGAVLCWRGLHQKFEKHLRTGDMRPWQRRWLPWLGTAGHAARGVVIALVGVFLVQAAVTFDPGKAVGVDGALHRLAARPFGPAALAVVAVGLGCYGLYSFVEARWRKVLTC